MENNNEEHNVDVFASGDSPHEGANVAVGVQTFVREANALMPSEATILMSGILDSPASRQLLRFSVGLDDYTSFQVSEIFGLFRYLGNLEFTAAPDPTFVELQEVLDACLLYTSPSPRDRQKSRMPSSA